MPDKLESESTNSESQAWTVLERRAIVDDRWISLFAERVRTAKGVDMDPFYILDESQWACIIPVLPDGRIVVVEQYRHGAQKLTWEFPAGDIDVGEDAAAAAVRELLEETGYRAISTPVSLGCFWPEPARNRSVGHVFMVQVGATAEAQHMEATEDIRVCCVSRAELEEAMDAGRFAHAVHVAAWYRAVQRGLL